MKQSQSKLLEVKDSAVVVSGVSHEEESTVQNVDESAVQNLDSLQQENIELKSGGKDENDEVPSTSRPTNGRVIRGITFLFLFLDIFFFCFILIYPVVLTNENNCIA